jgi:hypothetical protein
MSSEAGEIAPASHVGNAGSTPLGGTIHETPVGRGSERSRSFGKTTRFYARVPRE